MTEVRVVFSKWGRRPHWEFDAVRLGEDEHGVWVGAPVGTRLARPGVELRSEQAFVVLLPDTGPFAASFYERPSAVPDGWVEVYVDICTPPVWDGPIVRLVDLDLDVVKGRSGRVWVDDEDEFADHRVRFDYPRPLVDMALEACDEVRRALEDGVAPYDARTSAHWLGALEAAMMKR